ncbi:MAG: hypothetical protein R2876_05080 [Eubacteriales bacterium]
MKYEKEVYRYCTKKFYKNKSIVARILDFISAFLLIFILTYMLLIFKFRKMWLSLILSLSITASILVTYKLFTDKRIAKFMEKELDNLLNDAILEHIVLSDEKSFKKLISKILSKLGITEVKFSFCYFTAKKEDNNIIIFVFKNHPTNKISASEILKSANIAKEKKFSELFIISTSQLDDDAKKFLERIPELSISALPIDEFLSMAKETNLYPYEQTAQEKAKEMLYQDALHAKDLRRQALSPNKYRAYILCGIVSMLWTYIVGFNVIFPIIACASFIMAFFSYRKSISTAKAK